MPVSPSIRREHHQGTHHIGVDIGVGVFERVAHPGLRCQMDDATQIPVAFDQGKDTVPIGHIELGEVKSRINSQPVETSFF